MAKGPKLDRQALHDQLVEDLKGWSADYIERAKKASDAIYKRLQNNTKTPVSKIIRDALDKEGFRDDTADALTDVMVKAVARGYGALPSVMASTPATKEAMLSHRWDPSGLTLSQKLYRDYQHTLSTVTQAIQTSMKQGGDLQALSKKLYDGYGHDSIIDQAALPGYMAELRAKAQRVLSGQDLKDFKKAYSKANAHVKALKQGTPLKAAYRQMLDAAARGSAKHLERAVHVALEEKSRYHAERIARTECARAYYEGFRAKNDSDDNVVAYRWELSSAHGAAQHCDCEEHAEKDSYGLGPGVYPKNECPNLPSHPHCMCHLVEVYADEMPKGKLRELVGGGEGEAANTRRVDAPEVEKPKEIKKQKAEAALSAASEPQTKDGRLEDDKRYQKLAKHDERLRARINEIYAQYPMLKDLGQDKWKQSRDMLLTAAEVHRKRGDIAKAKLEEAEAAAVSKLGKARDAATRNDARLAKLVGQYIEKNNLAKKCMVGKLSHEAMRELSSGLKRMYKDCPGMPKIEFTGSMQELIAKMKADKAPADWIQINEKHLDSASAITNYYSGYCGITINEKCGSDPESWKEGLRYSVNSKYRPASCDTIRSIVDHEAAHAKDHYLGLRSDPAINKLYDDWMKLSKDKRAETLCSYPYETYDDKIKKGKTADDARNAGIAEFIAEGAAEYKNNPTPRAIAKSIGERIIELEDAQRGGNQ